MRELDELLQSLEKARIDLTVSYQRDPYEVYYEKSLQVDKLLEEYLDAKAKEQSTVPPLSTPK